METETNPPIREIKSSTPNLKARLAGILIFLIPLIILLLSYSNERKKNGADAIIEIKKPFSEVNILAKAAYVWDIENQKAIYAKNEKERLPLASLTKVMTALVAMEEGNGSEKVRITPDAIKQEGDSGLKSGEKWKLKDLIDFSLVTSSNDGIYAVASAIESQKSISATSAPAEMTDNAKSRSDTDQARKNFVDLMNEKAKGISLSQTSYLNATGLDASGSENGGYGSAEDTAKLFAYIIKNKPEVLEATAYGKIKLTSLDKISHTAQNTDEIVAMIPNLIASKTGYTDISGGNLVVAFDLGLMRPIVISVLGSTREGRFEDMKKLIESAANYLTENDRAR
ncbi:MAG: D-alanyl-D-alanine carboxypeptidase [Patescibacteria group bacterium]|nr:serine hydrolase [Patescibacteria group bacterium]MDE1988475.1 D-alanyl-D-alanine carboxypeptidase [Patescibacteria group bacterium]MDE2218341.1 D-alanyl-D-alanine carboxypeptidase [Patescibacteria group bacterium]